jgi:hypothetical protein
MPGTCAWLVRKAAELTGMTVEDQVPGGVRGRATGLKLPANYPEASRRTVNASSPGSTGFLKRNPPGAGHRRER